MRIASKKAFEAALARLALGEIGPSGESDHREIETALYRFNHRESDRESDAGQERRFAERSARIQAAKDEGDRNRADNRAKECLRLRIETAREANRRPY